MPLSARVYSPHYTHIQNHSYLDHVEEHPTPKRNQHIIYQLFDMPWPLGDREFLMERAVEADRRTKTVTARCMCLGNPRWLRVNPA